MQRDLPRPLASDVATGPHKRLKAEKNSRLHAGGLACPYFLKPFSPLPKKSTCHSCPPPPPVKTKMWHRFAAKKLPSSPFGAPVIIAADQRSHTRTRLGTSVCWVTRDQKVLDLIMPDVECSWFLLSSECDQSRYYRVAHGTALIPNETQFPCRTLVACLTQTRAHRALLPPPSGSGEGVPAGRTP